MESHPRLNTTVVWSIFLVASAALPEAYTMIKTMPMKPNMVIWGAFLSACKVHSSVELGEIAAAEVTRLDPEDPWARVMMSSMYAKAQDWSGLARERREMNSLQMKKTPGCSSVELGGEVHEFVAGGQPASSAC
ncbi:hypothetical protein ACQ4PT_036392 [Festuca glaucescens]